MRHKACLTFLFFTLSIASVFAQPSTDFKHQLYLIDSLKVFIARDLKLDIPADEAAQARHNSTARKNIGTQITQMNRILHICFAYLRGPSYA
jgi:hypothetical protein